MAKGKSKRKRRKRRRPSSKSHRDLASKLREKGMIISGQKVIALPEGHEKMSEVIFDFVEPYMEDVTEYKDVRMLIMLAATAWNASMLPDDKTEAMIEEVADEVVEVADKFVEIDDEPLSESDREELIDLLEYLVERKREHFAHYTRGIADYDLTETEDGYHLSVISFVDADGKI